MSFASKVIVGRGQYHLAVAGGYVVDALDLLMFGNACGAPTRNREVVLTVSNQHSELLSKAGHMCVSAHA